MAALRVDLDVNYADTEAMIAAGERAEVLFVRALAFMKRHETDGRITDAQLLRLGLPGVQARAKRLAAAGLWERREDAYYCSAFLAWNASKATVEQHRKDNARRQAEWRKRHPRNDVEGDVTNALRNDASVSGALAERESLSGENPSLDGACELIRERWRWSPSARQRTMLAEIADRLDEGSKGYAALMGRLSTLPAPDADPIGALRAEDDERKRAGRKRADRQEDESARHKQPRSGPTGVASIGEALAGIGPEAAR